MTPAERAAPVEPVPGESWQVGPAPDEKLTPTARHILDVAEQLFAQRGIEAVSFRDIVTASGQRNVSAVAYHFGSREGLLGAMLARRLWVLNKQRLQRLQALSKAGRAGDVHAIIDTSFRVAADAVRLEPWGPDFVVVLAQVFFHPELDLGSMVPAELGAGNELVRALGRKAVERLPLPVFLQRAEMAYQHGTFALALWVESHGRVNDANEDAFETFVRQTVDFLAGGVTAPVSGKQAVVRR